MNLDADIYKLIYAFLTAFIITYISIPAIIKVSRIKKLYVELDERKVHTVVTPTLGGVAMFAGIIISILLFSDYLQFSYLKYYLAGIVILFFIGIKDDILVISARKKFVLQVVAAIIVVVWGNVQITNFHGFFTIHEVSQYIGIPLSIIIIVTIINAFNFIDGIDGYSGTIAIIITTAFGLWFYLIDEYTLCLLSCVTIASIFAFLRYNLFSKTRKIFMGDTGTLILGFIIAILSIKFNELNLTIPKDSIYHILPAPAVTFGILLVPIFDLLRIIFIRLIIKKPIFLPDKRHLHHVLLELGFSHKKIVIIMAIVNISFILISFLLSHFFTIRRLIIILLMAATILAYIPRYIIRRRNKKNCLKK